MVAEVLVDGKEPATLPVRTFDNGIATVNTEVCETLGYDLQDVRDTFGPLCTAVNDIQTAESFDDLEG